MGPVDSSKPSAVRPRKAINRDRARLLLAVLLCLVVPVVVAYAGTSSARLQRGLVLSPFGLPRILIAHSLANVPLALLLARAISSWLPIRLAKPLAWVSCLTGMVLAVLAGSVTGEMSDLLISANDSCKAVIRTLWCLALQWPWCLALVRAPKSPASYVPTRIDVTLAAAAAVLLPGVYASRVAFAQSAAFTENLDRGRLLRARADLEVVLDLAGTDPILDVSPTDWRTRLEQELAGAATVLQAPLAETAPFDFRLRRAMLLAMVDRLSEAERELQAIAAREPAAKPLLALVLQWRARWKESSALYREVLQRQLPTASQDAQALRDCVAAYEGLAFNARETREYPVAEAAYHEALLQLPGSVAGHFHFRLGQHYHQAGRPAVALEHLHTAARLQPGDYSERVRALVDQIRRFTPACFLGLDRTSDGNNDFAAFRK
jgi:hypothetical protein